MSCSTIFVLRDPDEKLHCIHEKEEHGVCESPSFPSPQAKFGPKRFVRAHLRPQVVRVLTMPMEEYEDGTAVVKLVVN